MKKLLIYLISLSILFLSFNAYADTEFNNYPDLGAKPATDDIIILYDSSTGSVKNVDFSYISDIQNVDEFGGLTAAVASIGATPTSVLIDTTQTVADNLSIPTTLELIGLRSGSISIASGKVLTLNSCPNIPPDYQFFTGSGTVTNNCADFIYGAWTGGSGVDYTSAAHDHTNNATGGTLPSGLVVALNSLQTSSVATGTTILPFDNTIPQNNQGDEYMTLAITPASASNILKVRGIVVGGMSIAGKLSVAMFQDSIANALMAVSSYSPGDDQPETIPFFYEMVAGTTSEITFKIRAGVHATGTLTFNGTNGAQIFSTSNKSSMTITEYTP